MADIRGVIFDVDGTLVDSNDAHARAWVAALRAEGIETDFERVRRMIGMGSDKLLPALTGISPDDAWGEQITARRRALFAAHFLPNLRAFPATRDLLLRIAGAGLRLAVASSAESGELDRLLEIAGASDLIKTQTSSGDAEHSKPDPDIIQAALGRLGLPPQQTLMVGDTPYDIEAAARAGVAIIGLRCGGWGDDDLRGAIAIYDDPADLLARYRDSPLADGPSRAVGA